MHKSGICHRDININNVIYNQDTQKVKIVDFNISKRMNSKHVMNRDIGTLQFKAPEMIELQSYNEKIDIWGAGVILYYLIYGKLPFEQ